MGTNYAFHTNWNITLLAVDLTSLVGVEFTCRKNKLYLSIFEMNDVMLLVLELVHMFINTVHTQTELTAIAELLGRFSVTKVTDVDILCLGPGGGHSPIDAGNKLLIVIYKDMIVNLLSAAGMDIDVK
jgi:hypothetical protein